MKKSGESNEDSIEASQEKKNIGMRKGSKDIDSEQYVQPIEEKRSGFLFEQKKREYIITNKSFFICETIIEISGPQKKNKRKQVEEVKYEDSESNEHQIIKHTEWPKCYKWICIDANCPQNDQLQLVCQICHEKDCLRCVSLYEYTEKILFSEQIKQVCRYKKSKHLQLLQSIHELKKGNPNIIYSKLYETLDYFRKSVDRIFDLDKHYQKTNIWRKEQVRQNCFSLETEKEKLTSYQIQFYEFILGFHKATINQFVVRNQRSQQAYDNPPIFQNLIQPSLKTNSVSGSSVVIDISAFSPASKRKDSRQLDIHSNNNEIVISDEEEQSLSKQLNIQNDKSIQGSQKEQLKRGKQQIIDINQQQNQLKELLYPSEQQIKEREEKENQKRQQFRLRENKQIYLNRPTYAQQQVLKKEFNLDDKQNLEEFFKQKEKETIISDEKITRSKSKVKQNLIVDSNKQQNLNEDEDQQSQSLIAGQSQQEKPRRGRKKKSQKFHYINSSECSSNEENKTKEELNQVLDLSQFNFVKHNKYSGSSNKSNLNKFVIKQEEFEVKKEEKVQNSSGQTSRKHSYSMDIENDGQKSQFQNKSQYYQYPEMNKDQERQILDSKKSPTNSSSAKEFITKIEGIPSDRIPFFGKGGTIDLEEEIDIILDDDLQEEEEENNYMRNQNQNQQNKDNQQILNLSHNTQEQNFNNNITSNNNNTINNNDKNKYNDNNNKNIYNDNNNNNNNNNSKLTKFIQDFDYEEDEDDHDHDFLERKKSISASNMYAEDSILSPQKAQLNTKIKRVFYEDFYLGQSSETEKEDDQNNLKDNNKDNIQQNQPIEQTKIKYQYQHFEYMNQCLDDDELTDRIIKTPIKSDAVRLYFNFEGNYTSIQSLKALEEILPKYENLIELCINLRNCFVWMELEILSRTLRQLKNLNKLSLNLCKTQIEIQHLFILVKNLNKMNNLSSLNIDLSENVFKNVDNHSLSIIGMEDLQIPNLSLHIDDFDLEQDQTQLILNVFCRKNKRLNKLYLINYGDMNKIHLVSFICGLVKKQRICEVILRIDISELKRKRLQEIISACQLSQSLVKLGFELTGKISPSVMEDFIYIGENCKPLLQFYVDITDLENDDQQILTFLRTSSEHAKNPNKQYIFNLKGRKLDRDIKDAISKTQKQNFRVVF